MQKKNIIFCPLQFYKNENRKLWKFLNIILLLKSFYGFDQDHDLGLNDGKTTQATFEHVRTDQ